MTGPFTELQLVLWPQRRPGGGGNYNVGRTAGALSFDVPVNGRTSARLSFNYFLQTEGGFFGGPVASFFDYAQVVITAINGQPQLPTPLLTNAGAPGGLVDGSASWQTAVYDFDLRSLPPSTPSPSPSSSTPATPRTTTSRAGTSTTSQSARSSRE